MQLDEGTPLALSKNLVLAASAGTGKTHALVGIVLQLLVCDQPREKGRREPLDPSRIVGTTFSRKAAAEIRARVSRELDTLANAPDTSVYVADLRPLTNDAIRARARRALARLHVARFSTLHSFATTIVRTYAVELGLGPGFELTSDAEARLYAEEAIGKAIEGRLAGGSHALRALADAAGGIDRLVSQLRWTLVALEEDGRSAGALRIDIEDGRLLEAEFSAFAEHARALLDVPRFAVEAREFLDALASGTPNVDEVSAAFSGVAALGKKTAQTEDFLVFRKRLPGLTNDEKGRRLARAFRMRHQFAEHALLVRDVLADAEAEIERSGRERARLSFGQVLRAARDLLCARPDIAAEVSAGIDALLVDEFQDTSRVQRDLLQLLWAVPSARVAGQIPPLSSFRGGGLLVVGDRKQSIYGFRGADVSVFAELAVGLAGAPAREALGIPPGVTWEPKSPLAEFRALRHNRRSVPAILSFANAFSKRRFVPGGPPPELFEIDYVPETEDLLIPPERAGTAPFDPSPRTTWLRITPKSSSSTRLDEALVIAEKIGQIIAAGTPIDGQLPRFRDMAVLATTNGMLDAAAFALAQAGVPYVVAGKAFFRTREVRDLCAMLALALDPSDRLAMLEVLRGPWASLHDETLLGLTRVGRGLVSFSEWTNPPVPELVREEDAPTLRAMATLIADLSSCATRLGPGGILREAVRARHFLFVLGTLPRGDQRVANAEKLLSIADLHSDARAFRRWLDDAAEQEFAESEAAVFSDEDDAVRLLTVHASKGLDFPIVFVPEIGTPLARIQKGALRVALSSGDEPSQLVVRIADEQGLVLEPPSFVRASAASRRRERAERQRLSYVAVTRAKSRLFLVGGRAREGAPEECESTLSVIEGLARDAAAAGNVLAVEEVVVPTPRPPTSVAHAVTGRVDLPLVASPPSFRSFAIAPTALADFDHCARRFELIHVLGLPEHRRAAKADDASGFLALDARTEGTLAHAALERVPVSAFGADSPDETVRAALVALGIAVDHPRHSVIAGRVAGFLRGAYARAVNEAGAVRRREVSFALPIHGDEGRILVLRGSMDLIVSWPDGSVDVIDYKSARGGDVGAYAFQLDVYALAARALFPKTPCLRVGVVFLGKSAQGGSSAEPVFASLLSEPEARQRLSNLAVDVVQARHSGSFPRVAIARCESIHCGFIGRCHARPSATSEDTEANASELTTT